MLAEADQVGRARLLAAGCRESGVWLGAVPVSSLGTQLDPEVLRIGIVLRLGAKVCEGHRCRCGCNIDEKGYHPLSCRYSAGRFPRHAELNEVIRRALQRAGLPSVLEPPGSNRGDCRRLDGISVPVPQWKEPGLGVHLRGHVCGVSSDRDSLRTGFGGGRGRYAQTPEV